MSAEKVKQFSKDEPSTSTIKEKGEKVKQSVAKTTKVSKSKNSKETEHSYAERSPSKMKSPDSKSIKSPIKSSRPKTSSNGNDPDADKPFEKVKVRLQFNISLFILIISNGIYFLNLILISIYHSKGEIVTNV